MMTETSKVSRDILSRPILLARHHARRCGLCAAPATTRAGLNSIQLTKSGRGRARPHCGFQLASQWDGRITSSKRYNLRGSARPTRAPHLGPRPSGVTSDGRSRRSAASILVPLPVVAQEHASRACRCTRGWEEEGERRACSSVLARARADGAPRQHQG